MNQHDLAELKNFISRIENEEVISLTGEKMKIKELAVQREQINNQTIRKNISPVYPVISTALAINWKENLALPRKERFFKLYPQIDTLEKLKEVIYKTEPRQFLAEYLNINSNQDDPSKNPKYTLLKNLCEGFLEYKVENNITSEIEAILDWANKVNINNLDTDIIGKRSGVGPAVVQNIQLTLNFNTIKGDRTVLRQLSDFGIKVKPENVATVATELGVSEVYLDTVLFEYGKAKK